MSTKNTKKTENAKAIKSTKKEETKMPKTTKPAEVKPTEAKPAEVKPAEVKLDRKVLVRDTIDAWLAEFKEEAENNGKVVEIKTWEKIPTCRALKVDGVTYFEMYFSSKGVRLCGKSRLIPEAIRPAGWNIIKNGLDLTIPTISENIAESLAMFADACRKSLLAIADEKAKEKAAKEAESRKKQEEARKAKTDAKKQEEVKKPEEAK